MGKGLGKKKKPDFSEVAFRVVREATGEVKAPLPAESPETTPQTRTPHKVKRTQTL